MKKALITGISGQCGSYLAELLLEKGYEVHGTLRRSSSFNTARIDDIFNQLKLSYVDLADAGSVQELIRKIKPDEIFNLAAQSHVKVSFDVPDYTCDITALGNLRLLEAIRTNAPEARFYQASSSEMFGSSPAPQNEDTVFSPCSPYGIAKLHAFHMTKIYRQGYNLFACNGILFNMESPRRGETFVTRKITKAAARIKLGLQNKLFLGNLDAKRDWGYVPEYMAGVWKMLQQDSPDDYVLATGKTHTIREFLDAAFAVVDLDWHKYVEIDEKYYRPAEVDILQGDPSKAKRRLGWEAKTTMQELAKIMVMADWRTEDAKLLG
jgi:GDPmannose 4,6-dehydratase